MMRHLLLLATGFMLCMAPVAKATDIKATLKLAYLTRAYEEPLPLSLVEPEITNNGLEGARVGLGDNRATGNLLGHAYEMEEHRAPDLEALLATARTLLTTGTRVLVADLEPSDLLAVADLPEADGAILLNIRSSRDELRGADCRKNVFHVAPSYAMRADALGQYLTWKRWMRWFVVRGVKPEDKDYTAAIKRTADRYRAKIVEEREIKFEAGNRRTDTGHQQIQTQIPMLTQGARDHDITLVADQDEAFGEYLLWRTSVPKPVAGTQGLMALAWHRAYEQYGGTQLQSRFQNKAKRVMTERDYLAWLAVRVAGEAVTRSGTADISAIREFILSPKFTIAAFKGQGLSFRTWDRQMRQPLLLTGPRALVSMSPQEGFLHENFLTDTLGIDKTETQCRVPN